MKRREFISLLGGATVTWPLAAGAQQPAMPVIGLLGSRSARDSASALAAFQKGLNETGFAAGKNVAIEFRWADGQYDRLPALAADLMRLQVAVIVAGGNAAAQTAKASTTTTPIVFTTGDDPIATSLVTYLNRPGGNITGATLMAGSLPTKLLELLHELVPAATTIAILVNSDNSNAETDTAAVHLAARALGVQTHTVRASTEREVETVFATVSQIGASALLVNADSFFLTRRDQLAALAARHTIPTAYVSRDFVEAGGLMSYGASVTEMYRQVGLYAGRILKGEKPADLPVVQPIKFDLVVNLKAANAMGLTIPESFLLRADEVIE